MHEASIAQALLDQLESLCTRFNGQQLSRVTLDVGHQSGVDPEALRFAFAALAPTSCAAQATLQINAIPTQLACNGCARNSHPDTPFAACPHCGSTDVAITAGEQLTIKSVDFHPQPQEPHHV